MKTAGIRDDESTIGDQCMGCSCTPDFVDGSRILPCSTSSAFSRSVMKAVST